MGARGLLPTSDQGPARSSHDPPPSWACAVMRTWSNGWLTTARLPGDTKRCCFGCDEPDHQLHYFHCRHLQYIARRALAPHRQHGPWARIPVATMLGLQLPDDPDVTPLDRFRIATFCSLFYQRQRHMSGALTDARATVRLMALGTPARGRQAAG